MAMNTPERELNQDKCFSVAQNVATGAVLRGVIQLRHTTEVLAVLRDASCALIELTMSILQLSTRSSG